MSTTKIVYSGYGKNAQPFEVRSMTFEEILNASGHIEVLDMAGLCRTVKVNGKVKTWKTRPMDCELSFKYGLYEFGKIKFENGERVWGPEAIVRI